MQVLISMLVSFFLLSCSTTEVEKDPLKYSRKLIKEGHNSLYENGAFQVPKTHIKLIPAGNEPIELATEMMGMRARQSFLTSINNAADAVYLIPEGSQLSLDYAKKIKKESEQLGDSVTGVTRPVGVLIADRSIDFGKKTVLSSWDLGKKTAAEIKRYGIGIEKSTGDGGEIISDNLSDIGTTTMGVSWKLSKKLSDKSNTGAKKSLHYAGDKFIKGYVAVPDKLSRRGHDIAEASDLSNFSEGALSANESREKHSAVMTDLVGSAVGDYTSDVGKSFGKAGEEFKDSVGVTGFGLAFLKSARWVLQGALWDGLIKPVSKIGAGSVGYVAVNFAAFPTMVVINEGVAVTSLAVEVTWNTVGSAYDLVAPSATAAVVSVYSLFQFTAGNLASGTTALGGAAIGAGTVVTGLVAGNTVKGVGYITGKGVQYIAVPLTAAGVTLGAGTVGVVAGGAGAITGSTVAIGGEVVSGGSQVFGNVLAGTTLVAGTGISVVAGSTVGIYEVSKAIVVPASYELGGGIVLGYGTVSQLAAHSVLAVADASYLVLSLEGPRWVVYAVKGDLSNGDDLPVGTMLDLETMQSAGEQFYYLPVSDEEMKAVVENVYQELPEVLSDVDDSLEGDDDSSKLE